MARVISMSRGQASVQLKTVRQRQTRRDQAGHFSEREEIAREAAAVAVLNRGPTFSAARDEDLAEAMLRSAAETRSPWTRHLQRRFVGR
jgi:hypothetical protein